MVHSIETAGMPDLFALRQLVEDYGVTEQTDGFAICYGSTVRTDSPTSDLDMLIVEPHERPILERQQFIDSLVDLHLRTGRQLDMEVPYSNKLFYTYQEIDDSLGLTMFQTKTGITIPTLEGMTDDDPYFASEAMKLRLCLNALTTTHILLTGNQTVYLEARFAATQAVGTLAVHLTEIGPIPEIFLTASNGATGKDYLGYCADDTYLLRSLEQYTH